MRVQWLQQPRATGRDNEVPDCSPGELSHDFLGQMQGHCVEHQNGRIASQKWRQNQTQNTSNEAVLLRVVPAFWHSFHIDVVRQLRLDRGEDRVVQQVIGYEKSLRQQRLDVGVIANESHMREIAPLLALRGKLLWSSRPFLCDAQLHDVATTVRANQRNASLVQIQQQFLLPCGCGARREPVVPLPARGRLGGVQKCGEGLNKFQNSPKNEGRFLATTCLRLSNDS